MNSRIMADSESRSDRPALGLGECASTPQKYSGAWTPVFLASSPRSGSTLLRLMMDAHPRITNPGECDFLFDQIGPNGRYPSLAVYRRWLSVNRIFLAKHLSIDDALDYPGLIRSFVAQFVRPGCVLAMTVHRGFDKIAKLFPHARYVHLIRDPRDVARSCVKMGWAGHVYYGVDFWRQAEASWDKLASQVRQNQYMELRYERLVAQPTQELGRICRFVGVEFLPAMLGYDKHSSYSPPQQKLAGQWERSLSKRELQLVEGKLGGMLTQRGYEPSGYQLMHPGLLERVMLALRNKRGRVRHQLRRYGALLFFQRVLATKLRLRPLQRSCQRRMNVIDEKYLK